MDELGAAAIQRAPLFASTSLRLRLSTPEASLESPDISRTVAAAKSHLDFLGAAISFRHGGGVGEAKVKIEVLRFVRDESKFLT